MMGKKTKAELYEEFCEYKSEKNKGRLLSFESINRLFNDNIRLQQEMLLWAYEKGKKEREE